MIPSVILSALKEGFTYLGNKLDAIVTAFKDSHDKGEIKTAIDAQNKALIQMTDRIESALNQLKKIEVESDITVDTSILEADLKDIATDISKLKIPSVSNIEASLKMIHSSINDGNEELKTALGAVAEAIGALSLEVPKVFSIDKEQMRALTAGQMQTQGGLQTATRISNAIVSAASASTEYNYTFPSGTIGWTIKLRDQGTLAYYSWVTGKLPSGGDSTTYMTIPQNFLRSMQGVDYSGKTIYLGTESASMTFEIEIFRV